jgi:hypothetical protein
MQSGESQLLQSNLSPPCPGWKSEPSNKADNECSFKLLWNDLSNKKDWLEHCPRIYWVTEQLQAVLVLDSCLAHFSTLKMELICCSEILGSLWTTWCYKPEDCTFHSHCHETLKSKILKKSFKQKSCYSEIIHLVLCINVMYNGPVLTRMMHVNRGHTDPININKSMYKTYKKVEIHQLLTNLIIKFVKQVNKLKKPFIKKMYILNSSNHLPDSTVSHPRKLQSSCSLPSCRSSDLARNWTFLNTPPHMLHNLEMKQTLCIPFMHSMQTMHTNSEAWI